MNNSSSGQMEFVRVVVLLCIVLALLALVALNAVHPLPIDFYSILLWLVLGLALCFMGLRALHLAHMRHEYLPWYREPDTLLCAGASFAVALSLALHYLSHGDMLTDALLLVVFGLPTLVLFAYSLRTAGGLMQRHRSRI